MKEIEALLFDVDGTLADTEGDGHLVAFNRAFSEAGLDWEWDLSLYRELLKVTGGKERIDHYLRQYRPQFAVPGDRAEFIAGLHRAKTQAYTDLLASGAIPLRCGVERLLREARDAGIRMAVATTTTPENVTALLTHTLGADAVGWFELIAAGDVVPAKKPAPDIYRYAMDRMALSPQACVAFEDSVNGVRSVLAAGIRNLVVTPNALTQDDDFTGASLILDHLGDAERPARVLQGRELNGCCLDLANLRTMVASAA